MTQFISSVHWSALKSQQEIWLGHIYNASNSRITFPNTKSNILSECAHPAFHCVAECYLVALNFANAWNFPWTLMAHELNWLSRLDFESKPFVIDTLWSWMIFTLFRIHFKNIFFDIFCYIISDFWFSWNWISFFRTKISTIFTIEAFKNHCRHCLPYRIVSTYRFRHFDVDSVKQRMNLLSYSENRMNKK